MSASNSLTTLVPVLDGTNYRRWAELMKAYLQQQGSWIMIDLFGGATPPTVERSQVWLKAMLVNEPKGLSSEGRLVSTHQGEQVGMMH